MPRLENGLKHAEPAGLRWIVSGQVQGVGFRYYVLREARRLGLRGDVRNLADGRVEIRVQGEAERLAQLLARVRLGPSRSRVDAVETSALEVDTAFDGFTIR